MTDRPTIQLRELAREMMSTQNNLKQHSLVKQAWNLQLRNPSARISSEALGKSFYKSVKQGQDLSSPQWMMRMKLNNGL